VNEAGALGAAILAGVGSGLFTSPAAGVEAMVNLECRFEPDPGKVELYNRRYAHYAQLGPLLASTLRAFNADLS
jgi:sugar (pentulose or hexulose) kinase